MQVAPERIPYLARLDGSPSSLAEQDIEQVGESIASVATRFALVEGIPAHRGIRG
jgi:hypothetical protein